MVRRSVVVTAAVVAALASSAQAMNGGTLRITPRNGWKGFELITDADNPSGSYAVPDTFDGIGTYLVDANTLRILVNHEKTDASISQIDLNLTTFRSAITSMIATGNTGGATFVTGAQQAYGRWTADHGATWTTTTSVSTTSFTRFCSGQSFRPNTFGGNRGFVDNIYITGEETTSGRLFAMDIANRDFYQVSTLTGNAGTAGIAGLPFDSWENAALLDTGETSHVALLLSPDGGSQNMQLYVGVKGKDKNGNTSSSFLARNGLAYGSYYYLNGTLPGSGTNNGTFDNSAAGALNSIKFEDVDTNPNNGTEVAIGVQETGLFTMAFTLNFGGGTFNAGASSFTVTKLRNHANDTDGSFGDADNVDWTPVTTLNGVTYTKGLIFVNEDSGTANGETWLVNPELTDPATLNTLMADTVAFANSTETSGILDISALVGYMPGSVLLVSNQGSDSSMTVLINPNATLAPEPGSFALVSVVGAGLLRRRRRVSLT